MPPTLYFRLSVTDRCNLRCAYCRPAGETKSHANLALPGEQIINATRIANEVLPIRKLRLTGGEPLLRPDIIEIVRSARDTLTDTTLAMTTNGLRLAQHAHRLRAAGLDALNVSLDSVDPLRFAKITGVSGLNDVVEGLEAAYDAGFHPIKINAVLLAGGNGDQLIDLVRLASRFGAELRFIELMPSGAGAAIHKHHYLSTKEALCRLQSHLKYEGALGRTGTATRHRFRDANRIVVVGFISAVSEPFCSDCDRLRLDARGRLFGCLRSAHHVDLSKPLSTGNHAEVREAISAMLRCKPRLSKRWMRRHMVAIGG